jgi:phytoene/squalene synthetase
MRTDNQSDALLCFASSHDANYPPEQNYVFHIHSLLPPTRDEVLALYTFMHLIDDIADNPSDDKPTRHDNVMRFVRSTSRFLQTGADPFAALNTCLLEDAALLALLETVQELNSVGKVEFPAISGLAAAVSLPNLWPDHPHIASFAEFDSYNETLFGAVSACLHLSIFSRCAPSRLDLYRCGFKDFMKGMQVINILMDLEEDVLAGHYR